MVANSLMRRGVRLELSAVLDLDFKHISDSLSRPTYPHRWHLDAAVATRVMIVTDI